MADFFSSQYLEFSREQNSVILKTIHNRVDKDIRNKNIHMKYEDR